jgi:ubiquitin carboxyl-terminal hydrolase 22/27/51
MDTIVVASKAAPLASPKVVKNSKGAIVPSSQMAHVEYGCGKCINPDGTARANQVSEHMRDLLENARKPTIINYRAILQNIFEKPSIVSQTFKSSDGRPVVSLRPLYLCLQCPTVMPESDREQHVELKQHCFCMLHWGIRSF